MRPVVLALVLAAGVAACQGTSQPPAAGPGLRPDLEKLCNAMKLSGAADMEEADRAYTMANWLGANITSSAGRKFLQDFAKLGQDKAARRKLLLDAARDTGLPSCPLADSWQ